MASRAHIPDLFRHPFGGDWPKALHDQLKRPRQCSISVGNGHDYITARLRIRPDSQSPWLDVQIGPMHIAIPATRADMRLVLKGASTQQDTFIEEHEKSLPTRRHSYQTCFFEVDPSIGPVFAGPSWLLDDNQLAILRKVQAIDWSHASVKVWIEFPNDYVGLFRQIQRHVNELVKLVRQALPAEGETPWTWYSQRNPLPDAEQAPRRPKMPWLFDQEENPEYHIWETAVDFFLDDMDRRSRLLEAAFVEKHFIWSTYNHVFCKGKKHEVIFEQSGPNEAYWKLHIWMNAEPKPAPPDGTRASYEVDLADLGNPKYPGVYKGDGICIHSTHADFAILTRAPFEAELDGQTRKLMATLKLNLKSTQLQIDALDMASRVVAFGDDPKHQDEKGYSLRRTILAHGTELAPDSPLAFWLNAQKISTVPDEEKQRRVDYIWHKFPLDESQTTAVQRSVFDVFAGIHLVKSPPGNGKTRTTVVILLMLASLNLPVLICAGSNQAVDTLLIAYQGTLHRDERLRKWCGGYCRFRTPYYQMASLRRASQGRPTEARTIQPSSSEKALEPCQIESLVVQEAKDHREQHRQAQEFLDALDKDRAQGLTKQEALHLQRNYEHVLCRVLKRIKVVAVTLNASGDLHLQGVFHPYAMLCDEAGQSLESDTMIALTGYLSLRSITLIGDPDQLPRRLVSCYPLTLLNINYRCHPDILDWPAKAIYKSSITASGENAKAERVGNVWEAFTRSLHHFQVRGLVGKRRLFIDAEGVAEHPEGSMSWRNDAHINVVMTFLKALYAKTCPAGRITPADVMLICPYKEQVKRVVERFANEGVEYGRCVTVDGSQGQESNVVIFMFTKPRTAELTGLGFLSSYQRLNVAMTRAKKLMIVVVNMRIWNERFVAIAKSRNTRFLAGLLQHAVDKRDVLRWEGPSTLNRPFESAGPPQPSAATRPARLQAASAPGSSCPPPPAQPPRPPQSGPASRQPPQRPQSGPASRPPTAAPRPSSSPQQKAPVARETPSPRKNVRPTADDDLTKVTPKLQDVSLSDADKQARKRDRDRRRAEAQAVLAAIAAEEEEEE
ncbi:hypothetical protein N7516_002268 [Penicillium verrucosum]|uniref:uncharacterized protein n=1 Tax=Penicillium verrucosum TaxID=60171 RepID=UPI002544DF9A|nr:uncharacterized protein N7516_002268 [Penicillium verrucosum]KAJ5942100.1 hypothetical protein N7516_002268 [Penicillium verrucosum]